MTFNDLKTEIKDRLNYTSTAADTRVGRLINQVNREITTSIGLQVSRQTKKTTTVTINNAAVTFTGTEKLERVWIDPTNDAPIILEQVMLEELRQETPPSSDMPTRYAITNTTSNSVSILLDVLPATAFSIYADATNEISDLSGTDEPSFPESFHDIIIEGVLIKEYRKLEKPQLAKDSEATYMRRLSDLRMFIAKSNFLLIRQGEQPFTGRSSRWRLRSIFNQ